MIESDGESPSTMDDLTTGGEPAPSQADAARDAREYRPLGSGELAESWDLGDFFEALGPVMRFPPKETAAPDTRSLFAGLAQGRRRAVLVWVALVLVTVAAGAPLVLKALQGNEPVPMGLHGVWTTTAERYAGRSFELSETSLRLGLGDRDASYPIAGVHSRDSSNATVYTIRYREAETTLDFVLAIGGDSVVLIRNLPDVAWRRVVR